MNLFQTGIFQLHSGETSDFKIECEALGEADWVALARMLFQRVPAFGAVEGVPRGGLWLADCLRPYVKPGHPLLIVDDVGTTFDSLRRARGNRAAMGAVVFARAPIPLADRLWVYALFQLQPVAVHLWPIPSEVVDDALDRGTDHA